MTFTGDQEKTLEAMNNHIKHCNEQIKIQRGMQQSFEQYKGIKWDPKNNIKDTDLKRSIFEIELWTRQPAVQEEFYVAWYTFFLLDGK